MKKPKVIDLYCGAGGAGAGYVDAGADVYGVDRADQPNYPFPFIKANALTVLCRLMDGERLAFGDERLGLSDFDLAHSSPPCQYSCSLTKGTNKGRTYINLIPSTRELLDLTGLPYVIENVQGADVRRDLTLCGETFGLGVIRHRYFEVSGVDVTQPDHLPHRGRVRGWRHGTYYDGPYVAVYGEGGGKGSVAEWQEAMGIDWTDDRKEIAEAIPPAFTELIGAQIFPQILQAAA